MPGTVEIRVEGKREVELAFHALSRQVNQEIRPALIEAAGPIRDDATFRAQSEVSHIGVVWSQMRVGATLKSVYVAPRAHRRGGSPRPNLAVLLMTRAMQPALDAHEEEVVAALHAVVDTAAGAAGFY